jgi:hypothetical protein
MCNGPTSHEKNKNPMYFQCAIIWPEKNFSGTSNYFIFVSDQSNPLGIFWATFPQWTNGSNLKPEFAGNHKNYKFDVEEHEIWTVELTQPKQNGTGDYVSGIMGYSDIR